jgi:putative oxidoreductase
MNCPLSKICDKYKMYAPVVLRVVLGYLFAMHGYTKVVGGVENVAGFFTNIGIPLAPVMAYIVAYGELLGGVALILGLGVRHVGAFLAIVMTVALFKVKLAQGFSEYAYDIMLLGASLSVMLSGAGPLSLSEKFCGKKKKAKKK